MPEEQNVDRVYPNPSANLIYIHLQHAIDNEQDVKIYDIFGREIAVNLVKESGVKIQVNISSLKNGMYFIRTKYPRGEEILKFIKQNR